MFIKPSFDNSKIAIKLETIKDAQETLKNKPLVAGFNGYDFEGHEIDEVLIGYFPESSNMRYVKKNGKTYLVIPKEYDEIVLQHQSRATDDDPKLGIIQEYLSKKNVGDAVCGMEIYTNCFGNLQKSFNRQSSREISMIMRTMQEWKRMDVPIKFENYGRQKYWIKESES